MIDVAATVDVIVECPPNNQAVTATMTFGFQGLKKSIPGRRIGKVLQKAKLILTGQDSQRKALVC